VGSDVGVAWESTSGRTASGMTHVPFLFRFLYQFFSVLFCVFA
jgi:hypothetical protein